MSDLSAMRELLAELEQSDVLDAEDVEDTYEIDEEDDAGGDAPPPRR